MTSFGVDAAMTIARRYTQPNQYLPTQSNTNSTREAITLADIRRAKAAIDKEALQNMESKHFTNQMDNY